MIRLCLSFPLSGLLATFSLTVKSWSDFSDLTLPLAVEGTVHNAGESSTSTAQALQKALSQGKLSSDVVETVMPDESEEVRARRHFMALVIVPQVAWML